jgi:hypothetical protein
MRDKRNAYRALAGKPERKRRLGNLRRRGMTILECISQK